MNVHGVRRNLKNVVKNYSDAQVKVREATSNDPWGPSSTLMSEVADLSYNVVAFSEIMQLVWKRLNDHGKNWRHVYKALVLLEYLIKTGSERVAQQCKENIFAIQTLKDFQHVEDNKDQGINVREKAKQLVSLLKDDERLRNERTRAIKAKERFAQSAIGIGSEPSEMTRDTYSSDSIASPPSNDLECARPQTAGEEELQLQLALAMSKEEADQEEKMRQGDDVRLQMALSESKDEFKEVDESRPGMDLLDINLCPTNDVNNATQPDPWGVSIENQQSNDPWIPPPKPPEPRLNDPWALPPAPNSNQNVSRTNVPSPTQNDPWAAPVTSPSTSADPWNLVTSQPPAPNTQQTNGDADGFDLLSNKRSGSITDNMNNNLNPEPRTISPNPFDVKPLSKSLNTSTNPSPQKKSAENFLGANSSLVNLDALVSSAPVNRFESAAKPSHDDMFQRERANSGLVPDATNPFALTNDASANPFQVSRPQPPSMNQMKASQSQQFTPTFVSTDPHTQNHPMHGGAPPMNNGLQHANNPFL